MDRSIKNNIISVLADIDRDSHLNLVDEVDSSMFLCYDEFLGYLANVLSMKHQHLSLELDFQPRLSYSMAKINGFTYCAILSSYRLDNYYDDLRLYTGDFYVFTFYSPIPYPSILDYLFPFLPKMDVDICGYRVEIREDGYTIESRYSNYVKVRDDMAGYKRVGDLVVVASGDIAFISALLRGAEVYAPYGRIQSYIAVQFEGNDMYIMFDTECDAIVGDLPKKYWPVIYE